MVLTNYEIVRLIVEHEQKGSARAEYAKQILRTVSAKLTIEVGPGYFGGQPPANALGLPSMVKIRDGVAYFADYARSTDTDEFCSADGRWSGLNREKYGQRGMLCASDR